MSAAVLKMPLPQQSDTERRLEALRDQRRRIAFEQDETATRRAALDAKLKAVTGATAAVETARAARSSAAAELLANAKPIELPQYDQGIAEAERSLTIARGAVDSLGGESSVRQALEFLDRRAQLLQHRFTESGAQVLAVERDAAEERLAGLAPTLAADLDRLVGTLTEIGAQADYFAKLGGSGRRPNGVSVAIGSADVARLSIGTPAHPAFSDFGASINIADRIAARLAAIASERGISLR